MEGAQWGLDCILNVKFDRLVDVGCLFVLMGEDSDVDDESSVNDDVNSDEAEEQDDTPSRLAPVMPVSVSSGKKDCFAHQRGHLYQAGPLRHSQH